jgi:hypothetical protein
VFGYSIFYTKRSFFNSWKSFFQGIHFNRENTKNSQGLEKNFFLMYRLLQWEQNKISTGLGGAHKKHQQCKPANSIWTPILRIPDPPMIIIPRFSFLDLVCDVISSYSVLEEYVEPCLPVKYPRTPGYRPEPEENKYNAW